MTTKSTKILLSITRRQQKQYHKRKYVLFSREAKKKKITHDEYIAIIKELLNKGFKQIPVTTIRNMWENNCFSVAHKNNTLTIMVQENDEFKFFHSNTDDNKNKVTSNPMPKIRNRFKNRTFKTLEQAFGRTEQYFKICVPQNLYYKSPLFGNRVMINNVCKEDYSSHYPSCAVGLLPDANQSFIIDRYEKPNEEYQFAFYPETGHIAVYNEFDTHNYIRMQEIYGAPEDKDRLFKTNYKGKETKTILMKASHYTLAELKDIYNIKNTTQKGTKEHDDSKMDLLKFVGQFEQNNPKHYKSTPFAHLAAVIKWRANVKMFNTIKKIGPDNVIQIIVDGIIHRGNPIGNDEHYLGNLVCEESNAKFIQRGINQYIVFGKETIKCHAGLDVNIESDNINDWAASPKVKFLDYVKTFVNVEEIGYEK